MRTNYFSWLWLAVLVGLTVVMTACGGAAQPAAPAETEKKEAAPAEEKKEDAAAPAEEKRRRLLRPAARKSPLSWPKIPGPAHR